ncbi:MAG: UDP-N-acetylmuramate dehydrogenase [Lachnospirales bacterium]
MENVVNEYKRLLGDSSVIISEPMSKHTTFRIGGNADIFVMPKNEDEILDSIKIAKENNLPYYIIGNGSNILVKDNGFRGVIIQLFKNFNKIETNKNIIKAQSGALLSAVAKTALNHSLTGMECLSGIPGTIGGAACMNAGAYGGEMKDIVTEVRAICNDKIVTLNNEQCGFGYRTSNIMRNKMIVLEVTLSLKLGNPENIKEKMKELMDKRNEKQPVEFPSAGSTFKRPEGYFAGKLIDDCGLRGYSVGQAQVSPKHCGFVVNNGGATATEVIELMKNVAETVYDKFGVKLEPEVRIIGE